jgi:hypothetical protein
LIIRPPCGNAKRLALAENAIYALIFVKEEKSLSIMEIA